MVLFFTHIPFVVNHTINATPPERLQQLHNTNHLHHMDNPHAVTCRCSDRDLEGALLRNQTNAIASRYMHADVYEKISVFSITTDRRKTYISLNSCWYSSSPLPPSTSASSLVIISFSNFREWKTCVRTHTREVATSAKAALLQPRFGFRGKNNSTTKKVTTYLLNCTLPGKWPQPQTQEEKNKHNNAHNKTAGILQWHYYTARAGTRTDLKCPVLCSSHCIMSKKMGMVAFLSSVSGTRVISSMGPTIPGMNFILCGPSSQNKARYFKRSTLCFCRWPDWCSFDSLMVISNFKTDAVYSARHSFLY